jgi:hypothetical protein
VDGLVGIVESGPFGGGSKSEREAIWLQTDSERLVLRRKAGPTYGDSELAKYVGKRVSCDGFVVGYTLLTECIRILK